MSGAPGHLDCLVVGAGFAGLYLLHRLRGLGLKTLVLEAGDDVGGTWYWNRYPGARCDVESFEYSYHFSPELEQEWNWSERYATQPEILRYAEHVAERFDLRRDIQFNTRVATAQFDEGQNLWRVTSAEGESFSAPFLIMATGCLSVANFPAFPGDQDFRGHIFHTGRWPKEKVDFTGLKVGVIGTGSSAIQSIPLIAQEASQLTVFQRTANYIVPAHNRAWGETERRAIKANYGALRERALKTFNAIDTRFNPSPVASASQEDFVRIMEERWQAGGLPFLTAFGDILRNPEANQAVAQFVRGKIRAIVKDPKIADLLTPDFAIGCKRLCVDSGYWETFNRPNVELVDVKQTPIVSLIPQGLRTKDRAFHFDAIVFATGFDAMTGALTAIDIQGRGGQRLREKWAAGPSAYLGLAVAGFPNLFTVTGPGCPAVLTNVLMSIEHHVDWIATCLERMRVQGQRLIEVDAAAEYAWGLEVAEAAGSTLRLGCNSWYLGANIEGKPRVYMPYAGGFPAYCQRVTEITEAGYRGFRRT